MKTRILILLLVSAVLVSGYKKRSECVFPFKYNGKMYDDCVTEDAAAPWCSPNPVYKGLFFYCNDNQGDAIEKNGNFLSSQKKLLDNKKILDNGNFSIGDVCNNCGANLQVVVGSLSSLTKLSDDNERQINFLMDVENKNFKDFLKINYDDMKEYFYCPSGWYELTESECIHFGPEMTMAEGTKYCQSLGAQIMSIHNEAENKQIKEKASYIIEKSPAFIIGLTDEQTEGKYRWLDDSESTYINWSANEPNNYRGNEDCVMVYTTTGQWNDYRCHEKYHVACRGDKLYLKM